MKCFEKYGRANFGVQHIDFLALWLSHFIFCTKSLQVTKKMLTLAMQLHHGYNLCLAELILANLYESISNGVTQVKVIGDRASLLLSDPFWIFQLWLNATFESFLLQKNKINEEAPEILNRRVEGTRLVLLTPTDEGQQFQKVFTSFVMMFVKREEFVSTMAPFASQKVGP